MPQLSWYSDRYPQDLLAGRDSALALHLRLDDISATPVRSRYFGNL